MLLFALRKRKTRSHFIVIVSFSLLSVMGYNVAAYKSHYLLVNVYFCCKPCQYLPDKNLDTMGSCW